MNDKNYISYRKAYTFIFLFTLTFLIYSNTFNASWHFDDYPNILNNSNLHIKNLQLKSIYKTFFGRSGTVSDSLYRPVSCLTFALNWYFGEDSVTGYHIINITIHILTAFFLYLAILKLFKSPNLKDKFKGNEHFIALLTAVLWVVNPIQTQAVNYIVQRMTSLAAMFYVFGIYFYINTRVTYSLKRRILFIIGCILSFILAIGSKENAAMLPLALLLLEIIFFQDIGIKRTRRLFFGIAAVAGVLVFTMGLLLFMKGDPLFFLKGYAYRPYSFAERLMTESRIVIYYLSQIFYPTPYRLSIQHDVLISTGLLKPLTTLPAILVVILLVGTGLFLVKKRPIIAFAILFFFLNHVIESTIIPLEIMYEHRNYLPTIFLFFPVSTALVKVANYYREKKHFIYLLEISLISFLIICLCGMTYLRNMVWATEKTLWEDALVKAPNNAKPLQNMAAYYESIGQMNKALELYELSLSSYQERPKHSKSLSFNNMGNIYLSKGEYEKAIRYYYKALNIYNSQQRARFNMVLALIKMGKWEASLKHIDLILPTYYNHYRCLNLKGYVLLKQKKPKEAMQYFNSALQIAPNDRNVNINAGIALGLMGNYQQGERYLKKADQVSSNDMIVLLCIVENRLKAGDKLSAVKYLENLYRLFNADTIVTFVKNISKDKSAIPLSSDLLIQFIQDQNG